MSLFNLLQVPDKETVPGMRCTICKGLMLEQPLVFTDKLLGVFRSGTKQFSRFQCEDCNKELYIRKS